MNEELAYHVIQEAVNLGVKDFCLCPGARNSPLFAVLMEQPHLKKHYWFEERSAAFFALGKIKGSCRPAAVITTSGSAAGELLPAAMEAYYTGAPLLLITADRPRRFRGTGAPQAAEQVGLFGSYAPFAQDISAGEKCRISEWDLSFPAHLNVCFEEPFPANPTPQQKIEEHEPVMAADPNEFPSEAAQLDQFLETVNAPLVVVSALKSNARTSVRDFLIKINAPVFLEGVSGLREDPKLQHLRITRVDGLWESAIKSDYPMDAILRIGGIPTFRLWRDLEEREGKIPVCSISELPFSGLSWGGVLGVPLADFFMHIQAKKKFPFSVAERWLTADRAFRQQLKALFEEEPSAEPSLIYALSRLIPRQTRVFLGNSLPIREWDLAASDDPSDLEVFASRGVNGIDGQISTFLGLAEPHLENWAILGDLTTLYDLAAPWILSQMKDTPITLVVINNGGGQIFSRMSTHPEFLNVHGLNFKPFAELWGLQYERWTSIPQKSEGARHRLIEVVPDNHATLRFQKKLPK